MYLPIGVLIWIIPLTNANKIMMEPIIWRGNSLYILIIMVISTIFQFTMGKPFYISAWRSLKHKSANMDVLVVISTTTAWFYGLVLCIIGYSHDQEMKMIEVNHE